MPQPAGEERMGGVTLRSVCIACGLMPLLAWWVVLSEVIWYSSHSTAISLFYHVTVVVFVIALLNLLVQRYLPAKALTAAEMLTIYMMLSIAGTFCSHDMLQILVPMISYPVHAANASNRWEELILPHVPAWALLQDKDAARAFEVGNSSLYQWKFISAWLKPLGFWCSFLLVLTGSLLCINILFRRPWTEQERLSFPIIQIPLTISTGLSGLLKNRLFWIGFGTVAVIDILNNLNHFYPNVPKIPIVDAFSFREYLVERPWNSIAGTTINLFPFVIGLAFFLPTDLAFSCWFFYLFFLAQNVLTSVIGVSDLPGFPYTSEQAAGGYLALGLLALWLSRRHLKAVFRTVFGRPGGADDSQEPLRYRTTFILLLIFGGLLMFMGTRIGQTQVMENGQWVTKHASWGLMFIFFLIFFIYAIAIARMRAELGPPAHDLHGMGPGVLMQNAVGSRALGEENVAAFGYFAWFNRAYRAHFSAHDMEGFKLAQLTRTRSRAMMYAMIVAIVIGSIAAFWAMLHVCYVHGHAGKVAGLFASEGWNRLAEPMARPSSAAIGSTIALFVGMAFALLLGGLRMSFTWWLLHPVGYATASSWSMWKIWFCIFLGWLIKLLITRYGGVAAYRRAIPCVVGVVLGEFTVGAIFGIYGAICSKTVYHFWG